MDAVISKWDHVYSQYDHMRYPAAAEVLTENDFLLPSTGMALDLASGLGANAIFLAERGLAVTAWDISSVAIDKLSTYAAQQGLNINACPQKITVNGENSTKSSFSASR